MSNFDRYLEKAKDLADDAREQTSAAAFNAKEKVQGMLQDAKASKEIKQGVTELEAMQEIDGSILYKMEIGTMLNYLDGLLLIVQDNRMNNESVAEEIRKVMGKVQPAAEAPAEGEAELSDEDLLIAKAKAITYSACERALAQVQ